MSEIGQYMLIILIILGCFCSLASTYVGSIGGCSSMVQQTISSSAIGIRTYQFSIPFGEPLTLLPKAVHLSLTQLILKTNIWDFDIIYKGVDPSQLTVEISANPGCQIDHICVTGFLNRERK
jgi:hypothetical protein